MYVYQSFSSGQVFTAGEAQQIEDNIRDHVHGRDGLGAAGFSFNPASASAAFTVTQTNASQNIDLSGSFQVDFNSAATLGSSFGAGFTNIGSGRIVLAAAAGQFIGGSSIFVLTPGEFIGVGSDGSKLKLLGNTTGEFLLHREIFASSAAFIRTTQFPWMNDFSKFELRMNAVVVSLSTTTSLAIIQWSGNSGTNFATDGYHEYTTVGGAAATRNGVLLALSPGGASPGLVTDISLLMKFAKQQTSFSSYSRAMIIHTMNGYSRGASVGDYQYLFGEAACGMASSAAQVCLTANAFRFHTGNTGAYFDSGMFEIWGSR